MGKVHRIKKQFWKLVAQEPIPVGYHGLGGVTAVHVGRRFDGGSTFIVQAGWSHQAYKGLLNQLIKAYEAGVAHSDKSPVKG